MVVGIPKETKTYEYRVGMTPEGVARVMREGNVVLVERGAGWGAGFSDKEYRSAGAKIFSAAKEIWKKADFIVKVKEPQLQEFRYLRPGLILFTFLHLAANPKLARKLSKEKVEAIPYEDVRAKDGSLSILAPMSDIAGLLAPLMGANYLRKDLGGKGTLLSAVGSGKSGHVTILGAGRVGSNALKIAHGLGASVAVYDIDSKKLEGLRSLYQSRIQVFSDPKNLPETIQRTDLLIGAVLIPGKRAPRIITSQMIRLMEPGSVIVDVAVDQGGCIETIRPTTLKNPVYKKFGILHCGVTNIPSLVARTATEALTSVTLPYVLKISNPGWMEANLMSREVKVSGDRQFKQVIA